MKTPLWALLAFTTVGFASPVLEIDGAAGPHSVVLADHQSVAMIVVGEADYPVVRLAAGMFADDVERVTGRRLVMSARPNASQVVVVGTLGHNALIDSLAAAGKLADLDRLRGQWETTLWQVVDRPFPGVERALVIVGSDRRGAAYGLTQLSQKIGVSPWYWWSDVPVQRRDALAVKVESPQWDAPAVQYRGIFINDEDWGLNPWAAQTFDPAFGNIGPKTYARVFELMLRLRLNYLWPAMHECSAEFASQPENVSLADRYGIVAGSSHCEPMLCNNIKWDEKTQGKWDYTLNRDAIHAYWEDSARTRGGEEAVWTLGIRGIHDRAMEGPKEIPTRIKIVSEVIADQRDLLNRYVSREWGPIAQCFVPYKEVLPIYDAGLNVPTDVTLVWVDDNFGYLRRLSAPAERQRSGGAGVYWHLSYYGGPHSYTWINTTAPALMWEELNKAWQNEARRLWVINVGDIKPMEIGIDYFSRLAWKPDAFGPDSQPRFLRDYAARNFGEARASEIANLLAEFYRQGTVRKPELMNRAWTLSLSASDANQLELDYRALRQQAKGLADTIAFDAFTEQIGFPAEVLGATGLIFLADRKIQLGVDVAANQREMDRLRDDLETAVNHFNTELAGGKWNRMMPGLVTGKDLRAWSSQVRWPWGEAPVAPGQNAPSVRAANQSPVENHWRAAATADRKSDAETARWTMVAGLGASGRAMALSSAGVDASWAAGDSKAPMLEYRFETHEGDSATCVDFLPAFRLYPGMKLRVAIAVDSQASVVVEVPGSSGAEDEVGTVRQAAVQDNFVRVRLPLSNLPGGAHTLKISAMDPGIVIDRVSLP